MTEGQADLESKVGEFVRDLTTTLVRALPGMTDPLFETQYARNGRISILAANNEGIPLLHDGEPRLSLRPSYRCWWSSGSSPYLAIEHSSIKVESLRSPEPLVRFEYLREPEQSSVPASHVHVHGHRDEILLAMLPLTGQGRSRRRRRDVGVGKMPRVQDLHIPTGGHRFRPCLEDVLEFVSHEFGVTTLPSFDEAIRDGRLKYRERQLRAAVGDLQEAAAAELAERGWTVAPPAEIAPARQERATAY